MQPTNCQHFKDEIQNISRQMDGFEKAVSDFTSNSSDRSVQETYKSTADQINTDYARLIKEYQDSTKKLLGTWYSDDPEQQAQLLSKIQFESSGRVAITDGLDLDGFGRSTSFPTLIRKITGKATISSSNFEHIDYLEEVDGDLNVLNSQKLASLKRLKRVMGKLNLRNSQVYQLDALEEVSGDLSTDGRYSYVSSLKALKRVGGTAFLHSPSLKHLDALEEVGGDLLVYGGEKNQPLVVPNLTAIQGQLRITEINGCDFRTLFPSLQKIGGKNSGTRLTSISLDGKTSFSKALDMQQAIEKEIQQGKLQIDGEIFISRGI